MKMERGIKYFRDPIHGYIEVGALELKIINSPLFQRLRRIKQLGLAHYVYHGADHTRFAHSLGVMHIVRKILKRSDLKDKEGFENKVVLAALLHDIGHPPFSHSFEDAIGIKHEEYTESIIKSSEIKDILKKEGGLSTKEIDNIIGFIKGSATQFFAGNWLINSEIDADKLDYLLRDSLYCGVKYGVYDLERLLISLRLDESYGVVVERRGFDAVSPSFICSY